MNQRALALLSAALLFSRLAAAQDHPKMTDDEKIQWYCSQHADEGDNCAAHARQLLPYISDYAKYDDVDSGGRSASKDPSGCDFSPLPAGCPGSGSAPTTVTGGSGGATSGPGVGIGAPTIPISGNSGGGGQMPPNPGANQGPTTCGSSYVKSPMSLATKPEDFCADQKGTNFSVIELKPGQILNNPTFFHFSPTSALSVGANVGPAGTRSRCAETGSPGSGRVNPHCAMQIWVSATPGGPALNKCGLFGPIDNGSTLELESGMSGTSCTLPPGSHVYCNLAVPTASWGPYPAPFFYPHPGEMIMSECNALIINATSFWPPSVPHG